MHVARSQRASFNIPELVENEKRMVTGAGEMAVIGAAFLLAVEPAPAQAGVGLSLESMSSTMICGDRRGRTFSIHWPGRLASVARFSVRLNHFVSKRPI